MAQLRDRVARIGDGTIALRLLARERSILRSLVGELHEVLDASAAARRGEAVRATEDGVLERLNPAAHPDDPEASARFRELVGADLDDTRRARAAVVEGTLRARSLDDAQAEAWLGVLNDLRLVMGTRLGVTEESDEEPLAADDPRAAEKVVHAYLGWLEGQFVDVLAELLPATDGDARGGVDEEDGGPAVEPGAGP